MKFMRKEYTLDNEIQTKLRLLESPVLFIWRSKIKKTSNIKKLKTPTNKNYGAFEK